MDVNLLKRINNDPTLTPEMLSQEEDISSDDLFFMGLRYQYGFGLPPNHVYARRWYEKSKDKGHHLAEAQLKQLNQNENMPRSRLFLILKKLYQFILQFFYPNVHPTKNLPRAEQWYDLGNHYHQAQDSDKAYLCYEMALKTHPKDVRVLYRLGHLFQYGRDINLSLSKAYYERAAQEHHQPSQLQLMILNRPNLFKMCPTIQKHVVEVELQLHAIMSCYPWVMNKDLRIKTQLSLDSLLENIEAYYTEFFDLFQNYRLKILHTEDASILDGAMENHLKESAQALYHQFEQYYLNISIRPETLMLESEPCLEEMTMISNDLTTFQNRLDKISRLAMRQKGPSQLFSPLQYLSILSAARVEPIHNKPANDQSSESIQNQNQCM